MLARLFPRRPNVEQLSTQRRWLQARVADNKIEDNCSASSVASLATLVTCSLMLGMLVAARAKQLATKLLVRHMTNNSIQYQVEGTLTEPLVDTTWSIRCPVGAQSVPGTVPIRCPL